MILSAMDSPALIAKYDQRVPRYTSYPTAPHFSPQVTAAHYADWLAGLPGDVALSLYLHVPFCASLCLFCACHAGVVRGPAPLESYAATLLAEIELVTAAIGRRVAVHHVRWAGGTPTSLSPTLLSKVMHRLRERFDVAADAEIAIEVDPREWDGRRVRVTAMGRPFVRAVAAAFDSYVDRGVARHSASV